MRAASCLQWAFDPIFRWFQDAIILRNPAAPDFLQPVPCACGDDFAVAASFLSTIDDRSDQNSFECTDFHGLSQIIASLTREGHAEREAEIRNLSWTQTERYNALAKCRRGLRAWRSKKPILCLHAVTDEDGHPLENEDGSGRRLCEDWGEMFEARVEGERHPAQETILGYVQNAPDDIGWEIDRNEFDELVATQSESAPWS